MVVLVGHPGDVNWKTIGSITMDFSRRGLDLEVTKSGVPKVKSKWAYPVKRSE